MTQKPACAGDGKLYAASETQRYENRWFRYTGGHVITKEMTRWISRKYAPVLN